MDIRPENIMIKGEPDFSNGQGPLVALRGASRKKWRNFQNFFFAYFSPPLSPVTENQRKRKIEWYFLSVEWGCNLLQA